MFFILNKPKIYSYLIVFSTVIMLFFTATVLTETKDLETIETSITSANQEKPIENIITDKKVIAITINCLETDINVKEILEILDKHSVKATFCISGEWVKKYPEITKFINNKGHNIANMSDTYKDISNLSYEEMNNNIREGENKLSSLLNRDIKLFRCPYGKYNESLMKVTNENSYIVVGYDIDTLDYQGLEANIIWDNIKNKVTNGSIISMNSNAEHILQEIELICSSLREREYELVTVEELINL